MIDRLLQVAIALGFVLALVGLGIDYLLPGTSPGLNLPQLLIIAAGLSFSALVWQLRRPSLRRRLSRALGKTMLTALALSLITLVVLEILLTAFGMSTLYFATLPPLRVTPIDWWICDAPGCHYIYDNVQAHCQKGGVPERICAINRQGYSGSQDFVPPEVYDDSLRLLLLGDSFTFGRTAELGKSFAEYLESAFPEALIWNTGMSGTGTNQAVRAFEYFAPQLKPQLAILGFVMNDFGDNLLPIDSWFRVLDPLGRPVSVRFFHYDAWGNVYKSDIETSMRYFGHGAPPRNSVEHAIGITRLGTLMLRTRDNLAALSGSLHARRIETAGRFLAELRDAARAHSTNLLVLVIPRQEYVDSPSELYLAAIRLMEESGLPYIIPSPVLDGESDYAPAGDGHWNSAGHQKVGALLADCVETYIASGDLADCEEVILPTVKSGV